MKMATITIKNIPDQLYEQLKRLAEANHRSINSEVIRCIEQAVGVYQVDPNEFLATVKSIREEMAIYITAEAIQQAKEEGRP